MADSIRPWSILFRTTVLNAPLEQKPRGVWPWSILLYFALIFSWIVQFLPPVHVPVFWVRLVLEDSHCSSWPVTTSIGVLQDIGRKLCHFAPGSWCACDWLFELQNDAKLYFKKSRVCKIVKECIKTWCASDFAEGESFPYDQANKYVCEPAALVHVL